MNDNNTETIINPSEEDKVELFRDREDKVNIQTLSELIEQHEKLNFPRFEKVPYEQFKKDVVKLLFLNKPYPEEIEKRLKSIYDNIVLPKRSTSGSAGYDFVCPFNIHMEPRSNIMIPTGIRCYMPQNLVLLIYPRSGIASKNRLFMANTTPVIDSDYYNADNYGHIFLKICYDYITNPGNDTISIPKNYYHVKERFNQDDDIDIIGKAIPENLQAYSHHVKNQIPAYLITKNTELKIQSGDRIAQGIFTQYFITYDDYKNGSDKLGTRKGGHGSTGK